MTLNLIVMRHGCDKDDAVGCSAKGVGYNPLAQTVGQLNSCRYVVLLELNLNITPRRDLQKLNAKRFYHIHTLNIQKHLRFDVFQLLNHGN